MGEHKSNPNVNNFLFHYAKIEIFKSIAENRTIWATDLSKTNDPQEIHLGLDHINQALSQIKSEDYSDSVKNICEKIVDDINGVIQTQTFCTFCLSRDGDSIPMWTAYGDNCKGVSIGFHPAALRNEGFLRSVDYIEDGYEKFVKDSLLFIGNHILDKVRSDDSTTYFMNISQFYSVILSAKDGAWRHENEVRFVLPRLSPIDYENEFAFLLKPDPGLSALQEKSWGKYYNARTKDHTIYTEIAFGKGTPRGIDHSRSIKKVILGPLCEHSAEYIRDILINNGYLSVSIEKSKRKMR